MITKSKKEFDNKTVNQIELFDNDDNEADILESIDDWQFEERLSKEFESIGFFISDHPLNQFKEIYEDYKIVDYQKFYQDDEMKENNVAATLLKIHEEKQQKEILMRS